MSTIRLVLGYDSATLPASVAATLRAAPDVIFVGTATTPELLLELISDIQPDVVLLAVSPQTGFGHSFVQMLATTFPNCRLVLLGPNTDAQLVGFLVSLGVLGYVCQQSPTAVLLQAIREAAVGRGFIDPDVKPATAKKRTPVVEQPHADEPPPTFFTSREIEVLRLLAQGFTNLEVAQQVSLSIKSIESYRARIARKLGSRSRSTMFRYALENGLISTSGAVSRDQPASTQLAESEPESKTDWTKETGDFLSRPTDVNGHSG